MYPIIADAHLGLSQPSRSIPWQHHEGKGKGTGKGKGGREPRPSCPATGGLGAERSIQADICSLMAPAGAGSQWKSLALTSWAVMERLVICSSLDASQPRGGVSSPLLSPPGPAVQALMLSLAAPHQDPSPSTPQPLASTLTRPNARCPPADPRKGTRADASPRSPRHPPSCHVDDTSLVRNTSRTGAASCAMQRAGARPGLLQRREQAGIGTRLPPSPRPYTAGSRSRLAALPLLSKPTFPPLLPIPNIQKA